MQRTERQTIENIIAIYPFINGLQEKIEREQERVIADMSAPARKTVEKLIELDNRRVDLCNLKVLYAFIRRGLGDRFAALENDIAIHADSGLIELAIRQVELAGYSAARAEKEFSYLFRLIKRTNSVKKIAHAQAVAIGYYAQPHASSGNGPI